MSEFIDHAQSGFKKTSSDLFLFLLKAVSGFIIGLTLALVMEEILGKSERENLIAFVFMIVVVTGLFLRVAKSWGLTTLLVFDLIAILIGMCLRLYIMVAPGM